MLNILRTSLILGLVGGFAMQKNPTQIDEFPQANAWYQASPSVVWCGDETSTTILEVHIVDRDDVSRVWLTDLGTEADEGQAELFDDGTHGDVVAGDLIFTRSDVVIPCKVDKSLEFGWKGKWMFLRVELDGGQQIGNNYGLVVGVVDPKYKDGFEVVELAPGISATQYALFIEDSQHEVFDDYPISNVYCGTQNYAAYQKLYSVLPDAFDIAMVQPGMIIFRPKDLVENVPYNVLVSNDVKHIGVDIFDNTARFGSAGQLKSAIYMSFGAIAVFDHEIAHTWGPAIGYLVGLLGDQYDSRTNQGHWNSMADMEGQLGLFYFDEGGEIGHFSYAGDETWTLISNYVAEPYSPLELYIMGLIPPEEVPPIHILNAPDTSQIESITATNFRTVTIEDIMASEGGERSPSSAESQRDFKMAFIVSQDQPYNEAAFAFFSLMSYQLTSQELPSKYNSSLAPFYWATGGKATLDTMLPLDLVVPVMPVQSVEEIAPTEEEAPAEEMAPAEEAAPTTAVKEEPVMEPTEVQVDKTKQDENLPTWYFLLTGVILIIPAWLIIRKNREGPGQ